jgi:hypothetical protein
MSTAEAPPKPAKKRAAAKTPEPTPAKTIYTVARDRREKPGKGWTFPAGPTCGGTVETTLGTGDYSLIGFEDRFVIERKGRSSEFAGNLFEARFLRELDRLDAFQHAFVFLEFHLSDLVHWPATSGIPASRRKQLRLTAPAYVKRFWELTLQHPNIHFQFVGDHGREAASSLFKRIVEHHSIDGTSNS